MKPWDLERLDTDEVELRLEWIKKQLANAEQEQREYEAEVGAHG